MVLQTIVTLATEAAGEETSKTPFYLLGGLLAVWAVVVSFLGIRGQGSFPGSSGGRAGVMAVSTVLVLATMASAVLTG
jgi:hypothetical protein